MAPKVTRRCRTSTQQSSSVSARVMAPASSASSSAADEPPQCSVCMDDLSAKRSLSFLPCTHEFHRTCAIGWLETRESRSAHACPLCRQRVDEIKAGHRVKKNLHLALGQRQPDITYVTQLMTDLREKRMDCVLRWLKEKNKKELATVRSHRTTAFCNERSAEYLADIDEEWAKLKERVKVYDEVHECYQRGYESAWNDALERIRNGERFSDYESDSFSDVFPDAESGDDENEIFREQINRHDTLERDSARHQAIITAALREGETVRRERGNDASTDASELTRGRSRSRIRTPTPHPDHRALTVDGAIDEIILITRRRRAARVNTAAAAAAPDAIAANLARDAADAADARDARAAARLSRRRAHLQPSSDNDSDAEDAEPPVRRSARKRHTMSP